ncbi:MAG: hypothetical protein L6Q97_24270 [Thermoanaerobaculia bacterium]|nr:hypothetical protein [Thermoanaerobaculia bacterium]
MLQTRTVEPGTLGLLKKFQHSTLFHVIKSLTYFDDAEEQADPVVFDPAVRWEMVKTTLESEVKKLYK